MLATLVTPDCLQVCLQDQAYIIQSIFSLMVDIDVSPTPPPAHFDEAIASALFFEQGANGVILVECARNLAFVFTARFMSVPTPTDVDPDVADSMAELANMVGGNLKGLMPADTHLSMPILLDTDEVPPLIAPRTLLTELFFASAYGPCRVRLFDAA